MEYRVTKIVELNSKKIRIELNYEITFSMYKGEVRRYKIKEGNNLSESTYKEIFEDVLPKRAYERCINLLAARSMTEMEIRRKLHSGYYPECIIDMVIRKLRTYSFISDEDYVNSYVETYKNSKSIRQIKLNLTKKGISGELIKGVCEETDIDETDNIYKLMKKKSFDYEKADDIARNKFASFLMRKGYNYDLIRKCVFK